MVGDQLAGPAQGGEVDRDGGGVDRRIGKGLVEAAATETGSAYCGLLQRWVAVSITGWVLCASLTHAGSSSAVLYGHRIVAARSANAVLIRASCCTQAGYSMALRPAQIGSPMIRTRTPGMRVGEGEQDRGDDPAGVATGDRHVDMCTSSASLPSASRSSRRLAVGTATATGSPAVSPSMMNGTVPAR